MKKLFITGVVLCSAIILIGAQTGFAWIAYDGGCQNCHGTGFAALNSHAIHTGQACTICHVISGDVPATSKCIVCHPAADPGVCPLINLPSPVTHGQQCLTCHTALSGCSAPTTTTTVPTDCITIEPNSVEVSGADETLDVTVTFTRTDIIELTPTEFDKLVIEVDTTCAQYITINSSTINIGTAVTATLNITVQGTAPSSECSIKVSDPEGIADPPLNCEASFTITQAPTTTTTVPTTTTTVPQTECTVTVTPSPAFFKLKSALLRPVIRRIAIKGDGSSFEDYTAVSIEDIPLVIKLRTQNPEGLFALIVIPPRIFGRFTPGEKQVGVVTGSEFCSGTVEIE